MLIRVSLNGQCPNAFGKFFVGASLRFPTCILRIFQALQVFSSDGFHCKRVVCLYPLLRNTSNKSSNWPKIEAVSNFRRNLSCCDGGGAITGSGKRELR